MAELIVSVSGLRGIVGDSLTHEVAERFAWAYGCGLPPGPVVVTRDGRANGYELLAPVAKGLARAGVTPIYDAGVAATPTTGVLVRQLQAAGGIQISASHNPAEYNGMKLFADTGRVLPQNAGEEVLARYRQAAESAPKVAGEVQPAALQRLPESSAAHLAAVLQIVDVARIRACEFRVLLDANHGAGSILGQQLLEQLGCRMALLGEQPDGAFAHPPEPTAENLSSVLSAVVRSQAVVGFCQDPDADRLALIDEQGRYIGEEYTLAICADHLLQSTPGPVVTNCSTSRMTQDLAAKYQVPFHRSAVGEANVVDTMLATRAALGGEGNGGVIDPRVGLVRDSFVGMALVLDALAERRAPLSALVDALPRYAICKTKITMAANDVPAGLDALERQFPEAHSDRLDGLRLDWPDRWLLVRASNTEPIVRAIAEAPSASEAAKICEEATRVLAS